MSGFFGFDTSLPERGAQNQGKPQQQQGFSGFQVPGTNDAFALGGAGEEEDLAVYTWGESTGGGLLEGGDEMNDETFGDDLGGITNNFQFSSQPAPQPSKGYGQSTATGKIASTQSRYKPKAAYDPFAFSEDDFYSSRPSKKSTTTKAPARPKPSTAQSGSVENLWNKPAVSSPAWGTAPSAMTRPTPPSSASLPSQGPPAPGHIKSLEEIEAEMAQMAMPSTSSAAPTQQKVFSLEEIERQMMEQTVEPPRQATPQQPLPPREATPTQVPGLAASGYSSQQALLDSMFPELGKGVPASGLGQGTPSFVSDQTGSHEPPRPSPEELARMEELHQRITAKIESMAKYNNLMGSSDKDFITRIQLSQLATADPYVSDFYAQVFSALKRSRMISEGQGENPTVVQVGAGLGLGVGGPVGNRFGKMGQNTMTKLSTQVKKLVENRAQHQKVANTAALQGALGRVTRGNAAAPRPVLAIPTSNKPENRPTSHLNEQTGIHRAALTKKQIMFALEELYDAILELEQMRRDAPPPTAMEEIELWHNRCQAKVDIIWRRLMVMEPLDISNPHPFISLINPIKGQKLFPRLLRHLPQNQTITLLSLLVATYTQLDVVARAPPPPVADSSLLTKADRLDRAKREAETDNFLQFVIPGVDMIVNRCGLGLVAGMLAISAQRSEVWRVAATRPGIALYTALLSKAQSVIRTPIPDPMNPQQSQPVDPAELDQWTKTFTYFLHVLLPHLPDLFPSSLAQKAAFGPGAYLLGGENPLAEREGLEMEKREAEVWGFVAVLAVNAQEEDQTALVGALREKILHTVQAARHPSTTKERAEMKLRNVNMFLNGLGLDASMIE
ncbi:uncharacterized protein I206_106525 [Kwoniella pini CBS 10737]|uniref:DNA topoisomerase 2-associated protein PAT1 n=1 Tax=Kwoniella pini CBS 10737 TaxID=1296096 RepID=A0A1B9HSA4_9TREE|nr:DNA topoisomerase 2-associated protein PAT1 [Kwoniella pini CBS 10737]OCF46128.1 DNA topoisomerase 2-associated protein PAT1 [Kwoniella pini CBS 10737]